jgi:hypothetical protein
MGATTDTAVYSQATEQLNEFLREAAQMVRDACEWKRTLSEFYVSTGIDQRFYNYPANTGPGDIVRIARWDADSELYVELQRRVIPPLLDNDPTFTGVDEVATRDEPIWWEDSSQLVAGVIVSAIELNPLPDAVYKLKIEAYAASPLTDDTTTCNLDADCVLLYAYAEMLDSDGESARADKQRAKAQARVRLLSGAQRVGPTIVKGGAETARLRYGRGRINRVLNFDTGLSQMPPT